MSNKLDTILSKTVNSTTPNSPNYAKNINNKAHNQSPYGTDEPSTKTTFK